MSKTETDTSVRVVKSRAGATRTDEFVATGEIVVGIDPGSRCTALVIRDGETVIHATTVVRDGDQEAVPYARLVAAALRIIVDDYSTRFPHLIVGIEGISDPKGFHRGQRAAINPKDIIRTGVTAGALAVTFPDAIIVRPGNNGSMHTSQYPASLQGRRPKDLPGDSTGAGTRRHEQSAYDVAGKALELHKESTRATGRVKMKTTTTRNET